MQKAGPGTLGANAVLNVPEWFGSAAPLAPLPGQIVGYRAPVDGQPQSELRPSGNGWHYVAADQRFLVEAVTYQTAAQHFEAWVALSERALEANCFYGPCFALPAAQHLAASRRPSFLLIWDETQGEHTRLCGLLPFTLRRTLTGQRIAENWLHDFVPLGTPLIDRENAIETVDLMLDWLRRQNKGIVGLLFRKLHGDGPIASLLRTRAALTGREIREFDRHQRAALPAGGDGESVLGSALSTKKRRELRRQRNRLSEQGEITFSSARQPSDVRAAVEEFLVLEASGWKGEHGNAFLNDSSNSTFLRAITRLLARDDECRIDALRLDGKPIAMGIVLRERDNAWLWKIAYDEDYAATSPGVQFLMDFTRVQLGEIGVQLTDSSAIPDHPMINHIWRDRVCIADTMISTQMHHTRNFTLHAFLEGCQRRVRTLAKTIFYSLKRRRPT